MIFKFHNNYKKPPNRIIILGSSGIIASNLQKAFKKKKINIISIGSSKLDLRKKNSGKKLKKKIRKNDVVIFISAEAPVKNIRMFINNIKICNSVCEALEKKKIKQLIYISSDAVYADVNKKISERSIAIPTSLHGSMHLTREIMLKTKFKKVLCILRPTLIYGPGDTHNGYGPNRFISSASKNKPISIFGNGEEKRDHIFIEDVVKIIIKCVQNKGLGILNLATGKVNSFQYLAKEIINISKSNSKLFKIKRVGPMPHNGYRPFNIHLLKNNFKNIKIFSIDSGIKKYLESFTR